MLFINTREFYTFPFLVVAVQVVITQATCISKTATEFENNCYELFTTPMSWTEAQRYCSNFNGTRSLAKVSSPSVWRFLNNSLHLNTHVWLGASDQLKEGEWLWTDGTKVDLTSMWGTGEPNDQSGNEDCLEIELMSALNDNVCSRTFSFICMEIHVPEENTPKNVPGDTSEKLNSLRLAEWIGIGIGIGVVVTLSLLAVVLAIKCRRKTQSLSGNLEESGNRAGIENQTKQETDCGPIQQVDQDKKDQLYADNQEKSIVYDNITQTESGSIHLVDLHETKHLYAEFLDQHNNCYINT